MRWLMSGITLALVLVILALWLTGADRVIVAWALDGQQGAQTAMAGALRRLRGGDPAAVGALMAVCFGYGFFHAAGPGHGKLLIGGYGAARQVGAGRLALVALASSLAQAASAILLVGVGLWVVGLGREQMTDLADRLFAPLSFAAIGCVGLWLALRGARGLWRFRAGVVADAHSHAPAHNHAHDQHAHYTAAAHDRHHFHSHDHAQNHAHTASHTCATCGHSHAPDPAALAQATGPREVAALILAVAIRPCTGALFVLILTAQMQVFWAGIAGTIAMALGTASVTVAVAFASVTLRRGVLAGVAGSPALALAQPLLELAVGALVAALSVLLVLSAL